MRAQRKMAKLVWHGLTMSEKVELRERLTRRERAVYLWTPRPDNVTPADRQKLEENAAYLHTAKYELSLWPLRVRYMHGATLTAAEQKVVNAKPHRFPKARDHGHRFVVRPLGVE